MVSESVLNCNQRYGKEVKFAGLINRSFSLAKCPFVLNSGLLKYETEEKPNLWVLENNDEEVRKLLVIFWDN